MDGNLADPASSSTVNTTVNSFATPNIVKVTTNTIDAVSINQGDHLAYIYTGGINFNINYAIEV